MRPQSLFTGAAAVALAVMVTSGLAAQADPAKVAKQARGAGRAGASHLQGEHRHE